MAHIRNIQDVVDWGLCTGCGACAYACTHGAIQMENIVSIGLRPRVDASLCDGSETLRVCPGAHVDASGANRNGPRNESDHEFGPVLEMWEGYAADPEIRFRASSGGVLTALALYCLEVECMESVVHTGRDETVPWLNKTVQSRTRQDLISRTGSRYAPASPCDGLGLVEKSVGLCVFIGKPCDTAAVFALRKIRPSLDRNLGLVLSFFCAGTPSTEGTLDLARRNGVGRDEIGSVQYRGDGWPGNFRVLTQKAEERVSLPYSEAWGALTAYRPLRCNLCPDGIGRVSDISCGDAWEKIDEANPGLSIILVRTERGRQILSRAVAAGYVVVTPVGAKELLAAQPSLLNRRRQLAGRLAALRLCLIPTPDFRGFSLLHSWLRLPWLEQCKTFAGTLRRIVKRKWWSRAPIRAKEQTEDRSATLVS